MTPGTSQSILKRRYEIPTAFVPSRRMQPTLLSYRERESPRYYAGATRRTSPVSIEIRGHGGGEENILDGMKRAIQMLREGAGDDAPGQSRLRADARRAHLGRLR